MPKITPPTLDRALTLLGELMEVRRHPAQHFVVCGGSSLIALGLVSRTTTVDVDILARIEHNSLVTPRPLPEWLITAAVDRDGGRHLQDLLELSPTADELLDAARWTRTQDPSEGFLMLLRSMLASLGHENLNDKL